METEQTTGSHPGPSQAAVSPQLSLGTKGAPSAACAFTSRFSGAGVRYKAKLIGVDPVPDADGDKMCWDSMMKLKGCEVAARRQGKHKPRVWLNISSSGLRILDERTGAVLYEHDSSRISSLRRDDSDPRALAYVYDHQHSYTLFYIKMANLAGPVLADIDVVRHVVSPGMNLETHQEPLEEPAKVSSLLTLDNVPTPVERSALEDVLSSQPSTEQPPQQVSPSCELMEIFSIQTSTQSLGDNQPNPPASPQPKFTNSQILSIFPQHPVGGSPGSPPPYPPTATTWGQQGLLGNQWPGPAAAPWPTMPSGVWANPGVQPVMGGVMNGAITPPTSPLNVSGNPTQVHPPNTVPDLLQ